MLKNIKTLIIKLLLLIIMIVWSIIILNSAKISEHISFDRNIVIWIAIFIEFLAVIVFINRFYEKAQTDIWERLLMKT